MRLNFGFKKVIAGLTVLFFSWESAVGYALPVTPSPKSVTLLLNAHTSSDAQKSIAGLLESFRSQGIDLIGLEGADEKIDGAIFRKFPHKDPLKKAAWEMVKDGIFTGAEYFYITADKLPNFYGIEDKILYLENRDAFIKTIQARESLEPALEAILIELKKSKSSIYSKELFKLDQVIDRHETNEISFLDYFLGLTNATKSTQIALPNFPNVYALAKALEEEKQISLEGLKKDMEAISKIASSFAEKDSELLAMTNLVTGESSAPRSTDEIFENYQKIRAYFFPLIESGEINLKELKHFSRYWNWLERIGQVDPSKLFDELSALTDLLFERMAKTEKEKRLVREADDFKQFQKLTSIQLTQKEWKKIGAVRYRNGGPFLEVEKNARRFYELAEKRNEIFAEKTVHNMETRKKNNSVVVLGGFHEEGLRAALEAKGVSVTVISPKIESALSDIPYLDRMMEESTLEQALKISGLVSSAKRERAGLSLQRLAMQIDQTGTVEIPSAPVLPRHREPREAGRGDLSIPRSLQRQKAALRNDALVHFAFSSFTGLASSARSEARFYLSKKDRAVQIKIGTSGWRATDKQGFTPANVGRFAQAVAIFQNEESDLIPPIKQYPIAVGYDARPNARKYAMRAVEAIAGYRLRNRIGTRVDLIDQVTPTPVMGEATRRDQREDEIYGIALHITASHNPVYAKLKPREQWLGVKIFINGLPAPDSITDKIVAIANDLERSKSYTPIPYKFISETLSRRNIDLVGRSAARLRQAFQFPEFKERLAKSGFKVAFNNMYGANAHLAKNIFDELGQLGIVHRLINMEPMSEGRNPLTVKTDSGEEVMWAPNPTKHWFVGDEPDVAQPGILLLRSDGDADRVVAHDIDGKTEIDPNSLGLIFAHFLYHYRGERGLILRSAPTTRGLDRFAEMNGLELKATGVGSKNFAPYANHLLVAVEESGHIFFRLNGQMFADHSLASALLVMDIVATTGKSLSEYLGEIWREIETKTGQKRLYHYNKEMPSQFVTEELKQKVLTIRESEELRRKFAGKLASKLNIEMPSDIRFALQDKSGFGIEFTSFWVMPRNSGTEPKIRIYFEMPSGIDPGMMEQALTDTLLELAPGVRSEAREIPRDDADEPDVVQSAESKEPETVNKITLLTENAKVKAIGRAKGIMPSEEKKVARRLAAIWTHQRVEDNDPKTLIKKQKLWRIYHNRELPEIWTDIEQVKHVAEDIRNHFDAFVIVGIGGSDLGARALHQALNRGDAYNELTKEQRSGAPKVYFLTTFSDQEIKNFIDRLEAAGISLDRVAFNIISKSGTTPETFANFSIVKQLLKEKLGRDYGKNMIATTGIGDNSSLYVEAKRDYYRHILRVPDGIGGRYSVFTPVGLLYAAVAGIDIDEILSGLVEAEAETNLDPKTGKNTAYEFAKIAYLADTKKQVPIVLMNLWGSELENVGKWFRQLWAESLGKETEVIEFYNGNGRGRLVLEVRLSDGVVFQTQSYDSRFQIEVRDTDRKYKDGKPIYEFITTQKGKVVRLRRAPSKIIRSGSVPMVSIGSADNHSIAQDIQKGVRNKLVTFVGVTERDANYRIPEVADPKLAYLSGKSMPELMATGMRGTEIAFTKGKVPNIRFEIERLNARSLAKFFYTLETATMVAGELYGVNAFDQPGVEDYKKETARLLTEGKNRAESRESKTSARDRDGPGRFLNMFAFAVPPLHFYSIFSSRSETRQNDRSLVTKAIRELQERAHSLGTYINVERELIEQVNDESMLSDFYMYMLFDGDFEIRRRVIENMFQGLEFFPLSPIASSNEIVLKHLTSPWISIDAYGRPSTPEPYDRNLGLVNKRRALLIYFASLFDPTIFTFSPAYLEKTQKELNAEIKRNVKERLSQKELFDERMIEEFRRNPDRSLGRDSEMSLLEVIAFELMEYELFNMQRHTRDNKFVWFYEHLEKMFSDIATPEAQDIVYNLRNWVRENHETLRSEARQIKTILFVTKSQWTQARFRMSAILESPDLNVLAAHNIGEARDRILTAQSGQSIDAVMADYDVAETVIKELDSLAVQDVPVFIRNSPGHLSIVEIKDKLGPRVAAVYGQDIWFNQILGDLKDGFLRRSEARQAKAPDDDKDKKRKVLEKAFKDRNIRYLALDFDGNLSDSRKPPTQRIFNALNRILAQGVEIDIVSAGSTAYLSPLLEGDGRFGTKGVLRLAAEAGGDISTYNPSLQRFGTDLKSGMVPRGKNKDLLKNDFSEIAGRFREALRSRNLAGEINEDPDHHGSFNIRKNRKTTVALTLGDADKGHEVLVDINNELFNADGSLKDKNGLSGKFDFRATVSNQAIDVLLSHKEDWVNKRIADLHLNPAQVLVSGDSMLPGGGDRGMALIEGVFVLYSGRAPPKPKSKELPRNTFFTPVPSSEGVAESLELLATALEVRNKPVDLEQLRAEIISLKKQIDEYPVQQVDLIFKDLDEALKLIDKTPFDRARAIGAITQAKDYFPSEHEDQSSAVKNIHNHFRKILGLVEHKKKQDPHNRSEVRPLVITGKIGGTSTAFQAANHNGLLGERLESETNRKTNPDGTVVEFTTQDQVIGQIVEHIGSLIDQYGADRISKVHFTAPGFFNPDGTLAEDESNIPALKKGFSFEHEVSKALAKKFSRDPKLGPIEVRVVHDGTGGALGETSVHGTRPGAKDIFYVIVGTGVGTRRLINGKPFDGGERVSYFHNEGPHMLVFNGDPNDPDYHYAAIETKGLHPDFKSPNSLYYGKVDLEDRTNGDALADYAKMLSKNPKLRKEAIELAQLAGGNMNQITSEEVGEAANKGNRLALKVVRERGQELGIGLTVFLIESNRLFPEFTLPEYVVIGSGVSKIGSIFLEAVQEGVRSRIRKYVDENDLPERIGQNFDAKGFVNKFELSQIKDDTARELFAGLPTEAELQSYQEKLAGLRSEARTEEFKAQLRAISKIKISKDTKQEALEAVKALRKISEEEKVKAVIEENKLKLNIKSQELDDRGDVVLFTNDPQHQGYQRLMFYRGVRKTDDGHRVARLRSAFEGNKLLEIPLQSFLNDINAGIAIRLRAQEIKPAEDRSFVLAPEVKTKPDPTVSTIEFLALFDPNAPETTSPAAAPEKPKPSPAPSAKPSSPDGLQLIVQIVKSAIPGPNTYFTVKRLRARLRKQLTKVPDSAIEAILDRPDLGLIRSEEKGEVVWQKPSRSETRSAQYGFAGDKEAPFRDADLFQATLRGTDDVEGVFSALLEKAQLRSEMRSIEEFAGKLISQGPIQHIVVAEDDEIYQAAYQEIFEDLSASVQIDYYNNGKDTLDHILQGKPADLLITDDQMPRPYGSQIVNTIRRQKIKIPAMVVSSKPIDDEQWLALHGNVISLSKKTQWELIRPTIDLVIARSIHDGLRSEARSQLSVSEEQKLMDYLNEDLETVQKHLRNRGLTSNVRLRLDQDGAFKMVAGNGSISPLTKGEALYTQLFTRFAIERVDIIYNDPTQLDTDEKRRIRDFLFGLFYRGFDVNETQKLWKLTGINKSSNSAKEPRTYTFYFERRSEARFKKTGEPKIDESAQESSMLSSRAEARETDKYGGEPSKIITWRFTATEPTLGEELADFLRVSQVDVSRLIDVETETEAYLINGQNPLEMDWADTPLKPNEKLAITYYRQSRSEARIGSELGQALKNEVNKIIDSTAQQEHRINVFFDGNRNVRTFALVRNKKIIEFGRVFDKENETIVAGTGRTFEDFALDIIKTESTFNSNLPHVIKRDGTSLHVIPVTAARSEARAGADGIDHEVVAKLFSSSVDEIFHDLFGSPEFLKKHFGERGYERLIKVLKETKDRILGDHEYNLDTAYKSAYAVIDRASYMKTVDQIVNYLNKPAGPLKRTGGRPRKYPELVEKASAGIIRSFQRDQKLERLPAVRTLAKEVGISRGTINLHYNSVLDALKLKIAEPDFDPVLKGRLKSAIEHHEGSRSEARLPINSIIGDINQDVQESSIASKSRAEAREQASTPALLEELRRMRDKWPNQSKQFKVQLNYVEELIQQKELFWAAYVLRMVEEDAGYITFQYSLEKFRRKLETYDLPETLLKVELALNTDSKSKWKKHHKIHISQFHKILESQYGLSLDNVINQISVSDSWERLEYRRHTDDLEKEMQYLLTDANYLGRVMERYFTYGLSMSDSTHSENRISYRNLMVQKPLRRTLLLHRMAVLASNQVRAKELRHRFGKLSNESRRSEARREPLVLKTDDNVSIIWDSSRSIISPKAVIKTLNRLPDTTPEAVKVAAQKNLITAIRIGSSLKAINMDVVRNFIRKHKPVIGLSRWDYQVTPEEIIVYDSQGRELARSRDQNLRSLLEIFIHSALSTIPIAQAVFDERLTNEFVRIVLRSPTPQHFLFRKDRIENMAGDLTAFVINRNTGELTITAEGRKAGLPSTFAPPAVRQMHLAASFSLVHALHELGIEGRREDPILAIPSPEDYRDDIDKLFRSEARIDERIARHVLRYLTILNIAGVPKSYQQNPEPLFTGKIPENYFGFSNFGFNTQEIQEALSILKGAYDKLAENKSDALDFQKISAAIAEENIHWRGLQELQESREPVSMEELELIWRHFRGHWQDEEAMARFRIGLFASTVREAFAKYYVGHLLHTIPTPLEIVNRKANLATTKGRWWGDYAEASLEESADSWTFTKRDTWMEQGERRGGTGLRVIYSKKAGNQPISVYYDPSPGDTSSDPYRISIDEELLMKELGLDRSEARGNIGSETEVPDLIEMLRYSGTVEAAAKELATRFGEVTPGELQAIKTIADNKANDQERAPVLRALHALKSRSEVRQEYSPKRAFELLTPLIGQTVQLTLMNNVYRIQHAYTHRMSRSARRQYYVSTGVVQKVEKINGSSRATIKLTLTELEKSQPTVIFLSKEETNQHNTLFGIKPIFMPRSEARNEELIQKVASVNSYLKKALDGFRNSSYFTQLGINPVDEEMTAAFSDLTLSEASEPATLIAEIDKRITYLTEFIETLSLLIEGFSGILGTSQHTLYLTDMRNALVLLNEIREIVTRSEVREEVPTSVWAFSSEIESNLEQDEWGSTLVSSREWEKRLSLWKMKGEKFGISLRLRLREDDRLHVLSIGSDRDLAKRVYNRVGSLDPDVNLLPYRNYASFDDLLAKFKQQVDKALKEESSRSEARGEWSFTVNPNIQDSFKFQLQQFIDLLELIQYLRGNNINQTIDSWAAPVKPNVFQYHGGPAINLESLAKIGPIKIPGRGRAANFLDFGYLLTRILLIDQADIRRGIPQSVSSLYWHWIGLRNSYFEQTFEQFLKDLHEVETQMQDWGEVRLTFPEDKEGNFRRELLSWTLNNLSEFKSMTRGIDRKTLETEVATYVIDAHPDADNYYDRLGLSPKITQQYFGEDWQKLINMAQSWIIRNLDIKDESYQVRVERIQRAAEFLRDPVLRAQYDHQENNPPLPETLRRSEARFKKTGEPKIDESAQESSIASQARAEARNEEARNLPQVLKNEILVFKGNGPLTFQSESFQIFVKGKEYVGLTFKIGENDELYFYRWNENTKERSPWIKFGSDIPEFDLYELKHIDNQVIQITNKSRLPLAVRPTPSQTKAISSTEQKKKLADNVLWGIRYYKLAAEDAKSGFMNDAEKYSKYLYSKDSFIKYLDRFIELLESAETKIVEGSREEATEALVKVWDFTSASQDRDLFQIALYSEFSIDDFYRTIYSWVQALKFENRLDLFAHIMMNLANYLVMQSWLKANQLPTARMFTTARKPSVSWKIEKLMDEMPANINKADNYLKSGTTRWISTIQNDILPDVQYILDQNSYLAGESGEHVRAFLREGSFMNQTLAILIELRSEISRSEARGRDEIKAEAEFLANLAMRKVLNKTGKKSNSLVLPAVTPEAHEPAFAENRLREELPPLRIDDQTVEQDVRRSELRAVKTGILRLTVDQIESLNDPSALETRQAFGFVLRLIQAGHQIQIIAPNADWAPKLRAKLDDFRRAEKIELPRSAQINVRSFDSNMPQNEIKKLAKQEAYFVTDSAEATVLAPQLEAGTIILTDRVINHDGAIDKNKITALQAIELMTAALLGEDVFHKQSQGKKDILIAEQSFLDSALEYLSSFLENTHRLLASA